MTSQATPRQYSAPALEKGLDILELLADQPHGMTQSAIAAELGKSVAEVFRMLAVLEGRGYIYRERPEDLYYLSLRMYELANRHPPTKRLLDVAIPEMRALAEFARQSVHLGVPSDGELLVIAQVESPEHAGVTVRVGRRSLTDTSSGRVLLAFQPPAAQERWVGTAVSENPELKERLEKIILKGFAETKDESLRGITDITVPLLDLRGFATAALTVPYLRQQATQPTIAEVRGMALSAVERISARTH